MQARFDGYRQKVAASFARQDFMTSIGARLTSVAPGCVILNAPVLPGFRQQQGFAHGGLSFALGDSAAGHAALTLVDEDRDVVTTEMKIHYLAPARGGHLHATGQVIRAGRRLIVVRADIEEEVDATQGSTDTRRQVATMLGTMASIPAG